MAVEGLQAVAGMYNAGPNDVFARAAIVYDYEPFDNEFAAALPPVRVAACDTESWSLDAFAGYWQRLPIFAYVAVAGVADEQLLNVWAHNIETIDIDFDLYGKWHWHLLQQLHFAFYLRRDGSEKR